MPYLSYEDYDNLKAERDSYKAECDALAQGIVYKGNSVQHWWAKATAYKKIIGEMWSVLRENGAPSDGETCITEKLSEKFIELREKIKEQERLIHEVLTPKKEVDLTGITFKETRRRDCAEGAHDFQPRYDEVLPEGELQLSGGDWDVNRFKDMIYVRDVCRFCGKTIEREPEE